MNCGHCGDRTLTREYTLGFHLDGATKELELSLCTDCFGELCADPDIEARSDIVDSPSK